MTDLSKKGKEGMRGRLTRICSYSVTEILKCVESKKYFKHFRRSHCEEAGTADEAIHNFVKCEQITVKSSLKRVHEKEKKQGKAGLLFARRNAFTLAEVLITLAIIGIVAAMTMPALIQKQNEKVTVAKLKKAYNVLNNAYQLAIAENGSISDWGLTKTEIIYNSDEESDASALSRQRFLDILIPYLKVTDRCTDHRNNDKCEVWEMRQLHGSMWDIKGSINFLKLADGTVISSLYINPSSDCSPKGRNKCADFHVDINGKRPPNTVGIDIFNFVITPTGISLPGGAEREWRAFEDYCDRDGTLKYNGWACTAWVIYNENLDYLHCDDLDWDGKHSCKEK